MILLLTYVPWSSLSIGENRRSVALSVFELLCLHQPLFNSGADSSKEIETRVSKASNAFNQLRHVVWYHNFISIQAKVRIFRACVLPVLLYGSELWCLTAAQEQPLNAFYMKCLRTFIGVSLGDRMRNDLSLQLTGQPSLESILRRNSL